MVKVVNRLQIQEDLDLNLKPPSVHQRPPLPSLSYKKVKVRRLLKAAKRYHRQDREIFGNIYSQLLNEFHPLLNWAFSCWDFLLTTEGPRFLERTPWEKTFCRADYRAFQESDYRKLIHVAFKRCLLAYNKRISEDLYSYLTQRLWNEILRSYRNLENPPDKRQRKLTSYSYLRCSPYQFLNPYHHNRVYSVLKELPHKEKETIELYFLRFFHEEAIMRIKGIKKETFLRRRRTALSHIWKLDSLAYSLLLQIERY